MPIGFGGASVGNLRRAITDADADAAIRRAWDRGIRYFDTAPHYGLGLSERRLGSTLATFDRHEYAVSTKVGRLLRPRPEALAQDDDGFVVPGDLMRVWDFSLDGVRRSVHESLERLGMDRFDVLYAHDPDQAYPDAMREGLEALAALKAEGVVGAIGVGTNSVAGLVEHIEAGRIDVLMLANRWTLLDHEDALPVMVAADRCRVSVVAAGVFNSGLLARPRPSGDAHYDYQATPTDIMARANRLADACEAHGVDLPTAAIAFPLLHPAVRGVVLGMRSAADVDSNIDRFETDVPPALWSDLAVEGLLAAGAVPA
jgi:D-threo-aldose 1-dehydrogenase